MKHGGTNVGEDGLQVARYGTALRSRPGGVVRHHTRLVFQLPASITSVVEAPRLVSSLASPIRPECAVTRLSTAAARRRGPPP